MTMWDSETESRLMNRYTAAVDLHKDLVLPADIKEDVIRLVKEQVHITHLRKHNVEPRHKLLLKAPYGHGMRSFARGIAQEMLSPFFQIRHGQMMRNDFDLEEWCEQIICCSARRQCVLLFAAHISSWDPKRFIIITALHLLLRQLPSHVVFVIIDRSIDSQITELQDEFDAIWEFELPDQPQREEWLRLFESRTEFSFGDQLSSVAARLDKLSFAQLRDFGADLWRRIRLGPVDIDRQTITDDCVAYWSGFCKRLNRNSNNN
jgi:hypothetical protein